MKPLVPCWSGPFLGGTFFGWKIPNPSGQTNDSNINQKSHFPNF
jgi:hypothetical protein